MTIYIRGVLLEKVYEPICQSTNKVEEAISQYTKLVSIYNFIQLNSELIDEERLTSALFRVHYATALEGIDYDFENVRLIVNNIKQPLERFEQEIYGYYQAEMFLFNRVNQPLDVYMIHDMQRLFFAYPGVNKTLDLFTSQIYEFRGVDLSTLYDCGIASFVQWLNEDQQYSPLVQSWMLHGFVLVNGPFGVTNAKLARILQFYWLMKHHMTLGGLLITEKAIFEKKAEYIQQQTILKQSIKNQDQVTQIDFTSFVNWGLDISAQNLGYLEDRLRNHFKSRSDFDKLTPALKNVVNYVFEMGYSLKTDAIANLNERQAALINELYKSGVLQTKELYDKYEVNRKTIQRDFSMFEEIGLVNVVGEGRALKYTVPIRSKLPTKLIPFQGKIR